MTSPLFTFQEIADVTGGTVCGSFNPASTVDAVFTDTRANVPNALFIALKGEKFDAHNFLADAVSHGAVLLCIEQDSMDKLPDGAAAVAVKSTVEAYRLLAKHHRAKFPGLIIAALTGSCGKTSTKECLRAIFNHVYGTDHVLATEGNTNNHIGVPCNLLKLNENHKAAVLELGTSNFGEIDPLADAVRPQNSLIVSIRSSHIENFKTLDGTATEKSDVFKYLPPEGAGVIPYDCPGNQVLRNALAGHRILTFGPEAEADFRSEYLGGDLRGATFRITRKDTGEQQEIHWSVPGAHQACNAAGAAALASLFGITLAQAAAGIANTVLPGMRMRITERDGVTWVNDAYNANPDSMKASLAWLAEFADEKNLVLLLGNMAELGEYAENGHREVLETARKFFPEARLIVVGPDMKRAADTLAIPPTAVFANSAEAAEHIKEFLKEGDLVFLKASRSTKMELIEG